ncbi:hypothetical protein ACIPSE_01160 [Streptomyces sp. NPDC090106]|uniref:hypothetical protein n=1 Tax=Streptomyces sp. NPDC090106 TaxID=3365946 RepID=UPI0037F3F087
MANSTVEHGSGRTDLQESRGRGSKSPEGIHRPVKAAHLVDLAQRSVGRPDALCEMALAETVITRPYVSGTRGFARWSGITNASVREITGPDGKTSKAGFLWTVTRGVSSAIAEERDSMELVYSDTRTEKRSTSCNPSTPSSPEGQEGPAVLDKILKEGEVSRGNALLSARIPERAQKALGRGLEVLAELNDSNWASTASGKTLRMLDPGLDLWSEYEGERPTYVAYKSLGRRAWSLAFLCGLQNVTLAVEDIEAITGLSKRGAQALLKRLAEVPYLVTKTREGRSFVYGIAWFDVVHMSGNEFDPALDRDEVRRHRASKDMVVQKLAAQRGTPAGYLAFRLSTASAKREQYLADNPLPDNCSAEWRELVERGGEEELYAYLKAREETAPADPGGLVEQMQAEAPEDPLTAFVRQQAEARRAEPATKDSVVDQNKLAAMRARITACA